MRGTPIIAEKFRSSRWPTRLAASLLILTQIGISLAAFGGPQVVSDVAQKLVTLSDGQGQLALRLNYQAGCFLDRITVRGREVAGNDGVTTGIRMGGEWFTTAQWPVPKSTLAPIPGHGHWSPVWPGWPGGSRNLAVYHPPRSHRLANHPPVFRRGQPSRHGVPPVEFQPTVHLDRGSAR